MIMSAILIGDALGFKDTSSMLKKRKDPWKTEEKIEG